MKKFWMVGLPLVTLVLIIYACGTTNLDSLTLGSNLSVGGTATVTGVTTLSGVLNVGSFAGTDTLGTLGGSGALATIDTIVISGAVTGDALLISPTMAMVSDSGYYTTFLNTDSFTVSTISALGDSFSYVFFMVSPS